MSLESDGGMILTGENRRTWRKTCPSATSSTTNPTWIDPGANPALRGGRPATNRLNHGTALSVYLFHMYRCVRLETRSLLASVTFMRFASHLYCKRKLVYKTVQDYHGSEYHADWKYTERFSLLVALDLVLHPSNGATAQIGPWPPLLRFHNNNVLRCEVISLTANTR
jgi:hypothetical protein